MSTYCTITITLAFVHVLIKIKIHKDKREKSGWSDDDEGNQNKHSKHMLMREFIFGIKKKRKTLIDELRNLLGKIIY